ncbi:flavodoxin-dependent (E)-4-hydroxy-3-methylbut-2-enyl-diphosphate synthase [bacterium]|nr:flavodoxin-dependent (E)-4-hydroxy-3-methylbut-2-enyl-diphosphate synthase [bacterium]
MVKGKKLGLGLNIKRRKTRQIRVGDVLIGAGAPISVQSMTKTDTRDVAATLSQVMALADAGCEIVRISVPDNESVEAIGEIKKSSPVPIIADCHFDYRLAIGAIRQGVDGIRINPGNIGSKERVVKIIREAKSRQIPIRIGVNAGSMQKDLFEKFGGPAVEAMAESALRHIELFESQGFDMIKLSLKSSHAGMMIQACRLMAQKTDYPFHLGLTEAGGPFSGAIKSAVAMGILLSEGIGDTIRVSITGDPLLEVKAGYEILRSLGLRSRGVEVISCPTCARCHIDLFGLAERIERELQNISVTLKVAVMGCVVNGPGEARDADVGVAGGKGKGVIFRKGEIIKTVNEGHIAEALLSEVKDILLEKEKGIKDV